MKCLLDLVYDCIVQYPCIIKMLILIDDKKKRLSISSGFLDIQYLLFTSEFNNILLKYFDSHNVSTV